jgi:hypothetical protein
MYKFQMNEKVLVKSLNEEGIVVCQYLNAKGDIPKIQYQVVMIVPRIACGKSEQELVWALEQDLEKLKIVSPLEESLIAAQNEFVKNWNPGPLPGRELTDEELRAPTWHISELKPWGKTKECECGMEKHGFANHSYWCPKS